MSYKLLIVDDEKMLTDLLQEYLKNEGYLVYTANNAAEALEKLGVNPDLILLDINMPEVDGYQLCREIRSHVACPILFLTARIAEQDSVNGFAVGGDDYITKPFRLHELTARIAAHLRRDARSRQSSRVVASNHLIVNLSERSVFFQEQELVFSKREFDIIEFLMTHAGQVFDKERIYEGVWGYEAEGDSDVIKEHIRKIRAKIKAVTEEEYIETVWGVGYKWRH
ncbi:MAG: response regulator transcription factor [Lachnospiraceae bacterium]|nr:response regulator transcription factor [Lachnospiraceae bacterium]